MRRTVLVAVMAATLASIAAAKDYKVVIAQLSPVSTEAYTKIITAIIEATGNTATVQVLPFARAVYMIETKQADIESTIVAIPDKAKWASLKYDYATTEALKIVFVLYANKAKAIDVAELKKGNPKGYKLETDAAHVDHFSFAMAGSTSVDASLKKVDSGAIDGYVFGQPSADAALKRLGYKNVLREYYDTWSGSFLIQKGGRGGETDRMLTDGIAKVKASGKYQEIMRDVMAAGSQYNEWQP
jgi:polar amino acid transport system substrate-binding protein